MYLATAWACWVRFTVNLSGKEQPLLPRDMIQRAWGLPSMQIDKYMDFNENGSCVIGGNKCLSVRKIMPIQIRKCFFNISNHLHLVYSWAIVFRLLKAVLCLLIWPTKGDWVYICHSFSLVIKVMFLPFRIDPSVTNACLAPTCDFMSSSVFSSLLTINASKICGIVYFINVSAFWGEREALLGACWFNKDLWVQDMKSLPCWINLNTIVLYD